jgi:endonuclease YncB( thermonuclease family)
MAKVRMEGEWKVWAATGAIVVAIVGYLYFVSRPPTEEGKPLWKVEKVVDGKTVTLRGSGKTIQFRLIGLIIPSSEEKATQEYLTQNLLNKWIRIEVKREGPDKVAEGMIFLDSEDILARLIRQGLAKVDRDEQGFDVRLYIELEQEAKRQQKGLWSKPAQGEQ